MKWSFSSPKTHTMKVGESLTFDFSSSHNIWSMKGETEYKNCQFKGGKELGSRFDKTYTFKPTETGVYYFGCEVGSHCNSGMKIKVTVEAAAPVNNGPSCGGKKKKICKKVKGCKWEKRKCLATGGDNGGNNPGAPTLCSDHTKKKKCKKAKCAWNKKG